MKNIFERKDGDDGYVILHKGFISITLRIIYCLVAALIYVLFKLV